MDISKTQQGIKLLGQGEAVVIAVKNESAQNHYVKIDHPDIGETQFIPFIQTPGLYRVPRPGDICICFCKENFYQYPIAWGHVLSQELVEQLVGNRLDNITILYSAGENNAEVSHKIELDDGDEKGIRILTNGEHSLKFNDNGELIGIVAETAGSHKFTMADTGEQTGIQAQTSKGHKMNLNDTGEVVGATIETVKGHKIEVNDTDDKITLQHAEGAKIVESKDSICLSYKGSLLVLDKDGIKMKSSKGSLINITDQITAQSTAKSHMILGVTASMLAADTNGTVDSVVVSKHDHTTGNLGLPTLNGPIVTGTPGTELLRPNEEPEDCD